MDHPFLKNFRILALYFAMWTLIMCAHITVLWMYYQTPLIISVADGFVFNFLFAFLGLSIWYIVKFTKNEIVNLLTNHFGAAILILLIWAGISFAVLRDFFSDNAVYLKQLNASIPWRIISGVFYYITILLIYYLVKYYNNLQEKITSEIKLKEMVKEAELNLLKSQINPHFLFNSLNSISSLTITNPEKAQDMIIKLSDFMRYSISQNNIELTTLSLELQNIQRYLDIEQIRFGSKLIYFNDVDKNCLDCKIPAMILQPIYENAVKHGVYESVEPVKIQTVCNKIENYVQFKITNNFDPLGKTRKGEGIGLKNIDQRLKLIYQKDGLLKTQKTNNQFIVDLIIPQSN